MIPAQQPKMKNVALHNKTNKEMTTRIIINGKEVTNPFSREFLILGAIIVAACVTAFVIFVLFPVIGIAVTLSVGFILIFIVAIAVSVILLAFITVIFGWFFGPAEFRIEKRYTRKE